MYGCYDAYLIYGFADGSWDSSLDEDWLQEHAPGIRYFASKVVRNHICSAYYGIVAELTDDGVAVVSDADRALVKAFHERFVAHRLREGSDELPKLGFHVGLQGDFQSEHSRYDLDDEDEEDDTR